MGEQSVRKSYYPELQKRIAELERFKALLDQSSEVIILLHLESDTIIDVNDAACHLLECKRRDLVGRQVSKLNHLRHHKNIQRLLCHDEILEINGRSLFYLNISKGDSAALEITRRKVVFNNEDFMVVVARDITQKVRAENEKEAIVIISKLFLKYDSLEEIYHHLSNILVLSFKFPIAVVEIFDFDTNEMNVVSIIDSNTEDENIEVLIKNNSISHQVREECQRLVLTSYEEISKTKHPILSHIKAESFLCIPLKTRKHALGTITLIDCNRRNDLFSVADTLDVIAGHLALEINRKQAEKELINSNRELHFFTHRVSHSLKNPLTILKGFLSIIKEEPELFSELFDKTVNQADKLERYIENLLKLSSAGRVIGEKSLIDLPMFIKGIFSIIINVSRLKGQLNTLGESLYIYADPKGMEEVFSTLIENSIAFRDPQKEKLIIDVVFNQQDQDLTIQFCDNGIGIAQHNLSRVFDIGFTSSSKNGTGFGLPIVKKIIEAHKGKISVDSKGRGEGTCFTIILPCSGKQEDRITE